MSIKRITAVWDHSRHRGSVLLLLLAIADNANDDGLSWPSIDTLAQRTRMGKRAVINQVKVAEKSGELRVYRRQGLHNFYIVDVDLTDEQRQSAIDRIASKVKQEPDEVSSMILTPVHENAPVHRHSPVHISAPTGAWGFTSTGESPCTRSVIRTVIEPNTLLTAEIELQQSVGGEAPDTKIETDRPAPVAMPDVPLAEPTADDAARPPETPDCQPEPVEMQASKHPVLKRYGVPDPDQWRKRKDGQRSVPAAYMNPMKDAIASAFGFQWETMTRAESGTIQSAARQLCMVRFDPCHVADLHRYCQTRFENGFGPMALAAHQSAFRQQGDRVLTNLMSPTQDELDRMSEELMGVRP